MFLPYFQRYCWLPLCNDLILHSLHCYDVPKSKNSKQLKDNGTVQYYCFLSSSQKVSHLNSHRRENIVVCMYVLTCRPPTFHSSSVHQSIISITRRKATDVPEFKMHRSVRHRPIVLHAFAFKINTFETRGHFAILACI